VFASDAATAERLRSLRVHGQGSDKYDNVRVGMNARLDTLQAAILLAKIDAFPAEIDARGRIAARYDRELSNVVAVPPTLPGVRSAWAQYTIRTRMRDAVVHACQVRGIATAVYYRLPLNQQPAYRHYPAASGCARAARLANEVLSLPMYPDLDPYDQMRVVDAVRAGL
jgi:dTDP-4-amino-4,6-dideoxygalactose transaminase